MKKLFFTSAFIGFFGFFAVQQVQAQCPAVPFSVIELFTSQGCSYCPAAESALNTVIAANKASGSNVICIAEHVTYFNNPWTDVYSNTLYTSRQTSYCQNVGVQQGTPEAFASGKTVTVPDPTIATINAAVNADMASIASVGVCLTLQTPASTPTLTVSYLLSGSYTGKNLIVALVEDGLVTTPTSGENAGVTLHEDGVARKMIVTPIAAASGTISIAPPANCVRSKAQIVAYVQNPTTMVIYGATTGIDLATATTGIINSVAESAVNIYPNPAASVVTIEGQTNSDKVRYSICNMLGAEIKSGEIAADGTGFTGKISVSDLSNGMYFLKVVDGVNSYTQKLNKQ